jgi:uncharacterized membrane protein
MGKKKKAKKPRKKVPFHELARTNEHPRIQEQTQPDQTSKKSIALFRKQEFYYGPLPPPQMLQKFEEIAPGSAQIIINQFRKQSDHRIFIEEKVIIGDVRRSHMGMIFGFLIAISVIGVSAYLVLKGHPIEGTLFTGAILVSLVSVFVYGKRSREEELWKKKMP